jgi:hypothetical protein
MRWRWRGGAGDEWQLRAGLATSSDSAATGDGRGPAADDTGSKRKPT